MSPSPDIERVFAAKKAGRLTSDERDAEV